MTPTGPTTSHWTTLWQSGVLHSCNSAIQGNYDGHILTFWKTQFQAMRAGQQMVDLGTGNGALPLLAKATNPDLLVHGVDSAQINPAEHMRIGNHDYSGIRFYPGCQMSALPFPDGGIQLITSQYAFEYAPLEPALTEVLRVLDPMTGRIAMLLHSATSEVSRMTARQMQGLHLLFEELEIFAKAQGMARALQVLPQRGSSDAEHARAEFNASANVLMQEMSAGNAAPIVDKAHSLLHGALTHLTRSPAITFDMLGKAETHLQHERQRLQEMQQAAYDPQRLMALAQMLQNAGLTVETGELQQAGAAMGWTLVARHE